MRLLLVCFDNKIAWLESHNLAGINAQGVANPEPTKKNTFIFILNFNECEGKDSGNYTLLDTDASDAQCSPGSVVGTFNGIIAHKDNGEKESINLVGLSAAIYSGGCEQYIHCVFGQIVTQTTENVHFFVQTLWHWVYVLIEGILLVKYYPQYLCCLYSCDDLGTDLDIEVILLFSGYVWYQIIAFFGI